MNTLVLMRTLKYNQWFFYYKNSGKKWSVYRILTRIRHILNKKIKEQLFEAKKVMFAIRNLLHTCYTNDAQGVQKTTYCRFFCHLWIFLYWIRTFHKHANFHKNLEETPKNRNFLFVSQKCLQTKKTVSRCDLNVSVCCFKVVKFWNWID